MKPKSHIHNRTHKTVGVPKAKFIYSETHDVK